MLNQSHHYSQNSQKEILACYMKLYGPTNLREISKITGIQMTRVFRLFNGYEMRLSEYEAFLAAVEKKRSKASGQSESLMTLAKTCLLSLSDKTIKELETELIQLIETKKLHEQSRTQNPNN